MSDSGWMHSGSLVISGHIRPTTGIIDKTYCELAVRPPYYNLNDIYFTAAKLILNGTLSCRIGVIIF